MKNCLVWLLMFNTLFVHAQLKFSSLQEVFNYADFQAIALKSAVLNEQIASSEKKEVQIGLLPTISSSFGYNDNITLQPTLVPAQLFNPAAEAGSFEEMTFGTQYN